MTPAKFLNNQIPLNHDLSNMNRMITANFIVLDTLIFTLVTVREQFISLLISHLHSDSLCHWFVSVLLDRRFICSKSTSYIWCRILLLIVLPFSLPLFLLFVVLIILSEIFLFIIVLLSHQYLCLFCQIPH